MANGKLSVLKISKQNEINESSSISFLLDVVKEQRQELQKLRVAQEKNIKLYDNLRIMELLGIGEKLLKSYRDNGLLAYTQVNDKFWYTDEDVKEFLKKNKFKAFAYSKQ